MTNRLVSVGDDFALPQVVREQLTQAPELAATFVRFLDTDGNPIVGKLVTITVNTTTNEIEDITAEAI